MNNLIKYYSFTLIFYLLEVIIFQLALKTWIYDIFWLNMILRMNLVIFFSIIVKNIIFKDSKFFYLKFYVLIVFSPIAASAILKLLITIYPQAFIILLKFISDLISSLIVYLILKKIV